MNREVKGENTELLGTMKRWAAIDDNVVFVIKKTYQEKGSVRYKEFFENFILRVNSGIEPSEAIAMDLGKIRSPFMRNVMVNIQSVIENNGDLMLLLSKFEHEAFNIEKTLLANRIRVYKDRSLLLLLISFTGLAYLRLHLLGLHQGWQAWLFFPVTLLAGWYHGQIFRSKY